MGTLIPCLLFFLLLDIFQVISFLVSSLLVGILFSIGVLSHFMCWCVFGINHLLLLVPSQSCVDLNFDIIWTIFLCHTLVCYLLGLLGVLWYVSNVSIIFDWSMLVLWCCHMFLLSYYIIFMHFVGLTYRQDAQCQFPVFVAESYFWKYSRNWTKIYDDFLFKK